MNIYTYTQPEIYLKEMLAEKKRKNPQFSLRAWARLLGMKTHTPLQLMLASKRPIPKKYIPLFGKSLNLSDEEVIYLEVMIDHQRARSEADKKKCFERMQSVRSLKLTETQEVETTEEKSSVPNLVLISNEEHTTNAYN
ncbi:MAG: TIGR02147 family protein [Bacteriovoracaceae bacterium]|nr:TIGR02147 family protein [Bacteriovoracaceae bacterium]